MILLLLFDLFLFLSNIVRLPSHMPHADSSLVPSTIKDKSEFWAHVYTQLEALLVGQRHWVTNLANASALIYNSLISFPAHFGSDDRAVNWCGFYIDSTLFPVPKYSAGTPQHTGHNTNRLLLGPFCGKPACQFITVEPGKARGVCADSYLQRQILLVPEVDRYPGHIACDGETKSEIVCPLFSTSEVVLGVLDLDCLAMSGFDEEDKAGLQRIAELVVKSCDW